VLEGGEADIQRAQHDTTGEVCQVFLVFLGPKQTLLCDRKQKPSKRHLLDSWAGTSAHNKPDFRRLLWNKFHLAESVCADAAKNDGLILLNHCVDGVRGMCPYLTSAALASLLFEHRSHKTVEKQNAPRLVYLFAHLHLLSSDSFFFLIFLLRTFFSDSSHFCFSICPYCCKFGF
jgi:hypothetical protein